MEKQFFCNGIGTLLVLSSVAASLSTVRLKSSGAHLLVATCKEESNLMPRRQQREATYPVASSAAVHIRQFHVKSTLYSRFAAVTINSEVVSGMKNQSVETTFQVQVPEAAFMSNFTMVVDGQLHVAKVLEKEKAEAVYQQAKERNQTAAQVKQASLKMERGTELFQITLNLAPGANVTFTLVYNELLERRGGSYTQTLVVQPGALVDNLTVTTSFAERQGFTYFAYTLPGSSNRLTTSSTEGQTELRASVNSRELVFRPSLEMQRQFNSEIGIQGMFTIYYSLNTEPQGGSILVQNNYFAHFFATDDLEPLPKNILFVIDISGSMSGEKILQARQAMLKILDDLKARNSDMFNILLFDDQMELWQESAVQASMAQIEQAKGFVQEKLVSRGGTNIHQALMTGLSSLLGEGEGKSCGTAKMIIFLTDGDPTSGITSTSTIISHVTSKNNERASIHSLGFGFNLNFDFLSKLSSRNRGLVRRIYTEGDAQDQLRDFYKEISSPVLCDVVASYSDQVVSMDLLSLHDFPLYFQGKEIVVAGKTRLAKITMDYSAWDARLSGTGASGVVNLIVPAGQVRLITEPDIEEDLTEKMWAYMKIKSLLKEIDRLDSEADKSHVHAEALNMSLTYGFVTPLTSFSIVVNNWQDSVEQFSNNMFFPDMNSLSGQPFWRASWEVVCFLLIGLLVLQ